MWFLWGLFLLSQTDSGRWSKVKFMFYMKQWEGAATSLLLRKCPPLTTPNTDRCFCLPTNLRNKAFSITTVGEGNGTPLQYSCLENPMDGGAWWARVHGVAKSQTRLSDFTLTFHLHALEEEMATHPSVLAWRIPGTGEPGGLPSLGSHRVGHDWATWQQQLHHYYDPSSIWVITVAYALGASPLSSWQF